MAQRHCEGDISEAGLNLDLHARVSSAITFRNILVQISAPCKEWLTMARRAMFVAEGPFLPDQHPDFGPGGVSSLGPRPYSSPGADA